MGRHRRCRAGSGVRTRLAGARRERSLGHFRPGPRNCTRSVTCRTPTTSSPEVTRYCAAGWACTASITCSAGQRRADRPAAARRRGRPSPPATQGRRCSGTAAAAVRSTRAISRPAGVGHPEHRRRRGRPRRPAAAPRPAGCRPATVKTGRASAAGRSAGSRRRQPGRLMAAVAPCHMVKATSSTERQALSRPQPADQHEPRRPEPTVPTARTRPTQPATSVPRVPVPVDGPDHRPAAPARRPAAGRAGALNTATITLLTASWNANWYDHGPAHGSATVTADRRQAEHQRDGRTGQRDQQVDRGWARRGPSPCSRRAAPA